MFEQYVGLNGYLGTTDRAVLLTNGSGGLTAQASGLTLSAQNCLTIPGSTITASEPLLNLSQAWNNAGVAFTGIKFNATDTASASGSLLADFQVGGSSKFSVRKDGLVVSQSAIRGTDMNATSSIGQLSINFDTILTRDAASTLAQRNGANPQLFRIYNTYTDASNYERGLVGWSGNDFYVYAQKGGTGASRALRIGTEGTNSLFVLTAGTIRWTVDSTGMLKAYTDNTYDIGASGATRPRTGYFGTSLNVASGTVTANTPLLDLSQTWNNGAVTFNALTVSVTDTASAGGSLFQFNRNGTLLSDLSPSGLLYAYGGFNANQYIYIGNGNVKLYGPSANVFEQRNGVNAQAFNIYNTWSNSGTDYERLSLSWSGNTAFVYANAGGTGVGRTLVIGTTGNVSLYLDTNNAHRWLISGGGNLYGSADNAYDIGQSSANRPRTGYFGTSVVTPNVTFGNGTILTDDAANTLALRNGVNAQTFNVYNTWGNNGTDYERLKIFWAGNTCFIDTQAGGTGSNRVLDIGGGGSDLKLTTGNNLILQTSGHVARLYLASTGHLLWISDNTLDIGQSGANRPRTGYFGTSLNVASGTITASTPLLVLSQTWNSAGTLFDGITFDVMDSGGASASSTLLRLRVGGSNMFRVYKSGSIESASTIISGASVGIGGGSAYLSAVSSHVLELRNGVNPQTFGVYNTYTSSTNYERLTQTWATNVCNIWTEKGSGGGTARDLVLGADSTELVRFQTGSKIGFFGVTPVARPAAYTVTNGATDRAYDASATTVGELANVLNTLIADLRGLGLVA